MVEIAQNLMLGAAVLLIGGSLVLWVLAADRAVQERPLLGAEPRRPVPWTLLDMLIVAFASITIMLVSQAYNQRRLKLPTEGDFRLKDLSPAQQDGLLQSFCVSGLLVLLVSVLVLRFRPPSTWRDLGINRETFFADVRLGSFAFVMLFFPMTLIHLVATYLFPVEQQHPFIEAIREDARYELLAPIAFAAVIVAPLAEEFCFRVMVQGWLERVIAVRELEYLRKRLPSWEKVVQYKRAATVAARGEKVEPEQLDLQRVAGLDRNAPQAASPVMPMPDSSPETFSESSHVSESRELNPYVSPKSEVDLRERLSSDANRPQVASSQDDSQQLDSSERIEPSHINSAGGQPTDAATTAEASLADAFASLDLALPAQRWLRWVPIGVTSLLFAGAHSGQGPAPIPLFFLALGLGYLYQKTHRWLPCLVVHLLVNSAAVIQMWLQVVSVKP